MLRLLVLFVFCLVSVNAYASTVRVLTSTYPLYLITKNVIGNVKNIKLELLTPANGGCPHDYSLSSKDMMRVAKADVLIVNGLGLEAHIGLNKLSSKARVIDTSMGVKDRILLHKTQIVKDLHGKFNPHLFVSPRLNGEIAIEIARHLSYDKNQSRQFMQNAMAYAKQMQKLNAEFVAVTQGLKHKSVIQSHGVFDYLFADMGIEIKAKMQDQGREPSAAKIRFLINLINTEHIVAIFSEPQYPQKVAILLSKETGVPTAVLDPVVSGPLDANLDYFATQMRKNLQIIKRILIK